MPSFMPRPKSLFIIERVPDILKYYLSTAGLFLGSSRSYYPAIASSRRLDDFARYSLFTPAADPHYATAFLSSS